MRADIAAKLHARLLVVTKRRSDYYTLRWAFVNKGYRQVAIVFSAGELVAQLEAAPPDCVLLTSTFDPAERAELRALVRAGRGDAAEVHPIALPARDRSVALADYRPLAFDTLEGKFGPEHIPINVELELTSRCNARCAFCPIDGMERVNRTMRPEVLAAILERARELQPALVYLCGVGEPLLYPGIVEVVRELSQSIGCPVGINTNGQLLTEERFRELLDAGLSLVNVSINGTSDGVYREHMRYLDRDRVTRNLEAALAIKPEAVSLQGVITRGNHHELPELVRFWSERGVRVFTFNECSNKSGFLEDHAQLWYGDLPDLMERIAAQDADAWTSFNSCNFAVKQRDLFLCRVPLNFISVDVDGVIRHCMHDFSSETSYGRFADYGLPRLRELLMERVLARPPLCRGCNASELAPARVVWRDRVIAEEELFPKGGTEAWEIALAGKGAAPAGARAP